MPHVSLARRSLAPAAVSVLSSDPRRVDFLELPCWGLRGREREPGTEQLGEKWQLREKSMVPKLPCVHVLILCSCRQLNSACLIHCRNQWVFLKSTISNNSSPHTHTQTSNVRSENNELSVRHHQGGVKLHVRDWCGRRPD